MTIRAANTSLDAPVPLRPGAFFCRSCGGDLAGSLWIDAEGERSSIRWRSTPFSLKRRA
ncbi:MAG: hypothetical protein ACOZDY_12270 [Pseudomonadota bacterium]